MVFETLVQVLRPTKIVLAAADLLIEVKEVYGPHVVTYRCISVLGRHQRCVVDSGVLLTLHLVSALS